MADAPAVALGADLVRLYRQMQRAGVTSTAAMRLPKPDHDAVVAQAADLLIAAFREQLPPSFIDHHINGVIDIATPIPLLVRAMNLDSRLATELLGRAESPHGLFVGIHREQQRLLFSFSLYDVNPRWLQLYSLVDVWREVLAVSQRAQALMPRAQETVRFRRRYESADYHLAG